MEHISECTRMSMEKELKPIKTGFRFLDETIGGYYPGEVTSLGGWMDSGRSAFIIMQALHAALEQNIPTLLITGSMSMGELVSSMAAYYCSIEATNILTILRSPLYQERIDEFLHKLEKAPLYVSNVNSSEKYFHLVEKAVSENNIKIVFCDDIDHILSDYLSKWYRQKELACKMNVPIVCSLFCWISSRFQRRNKYLLSDFPKHVADVVLGFYDYEQHGLIEDERGNDLRQMLQIDILKTKGTTSKPSVRIKKKDLYVRNYTLELQKRTLESLIAQNDIDIDSLIKKFALEMVDEEMID